MKKHIFDLCLSRLLELRVSPVSVLISSGRVDGLLEALFHSQQINIEEFQILNMLNCCAFAYSGRPFPSSRNVGPLIPLWIANERNLEAASA